MGRQSSDIKTGQHTISLWPNIKKTNEIQNVTLESVVKRIKSDEFKKQIQSLRALREQDKKNDIRNESGALQYKLSKPVKESLPAITTTGTFERRTKKGIISYNGIMSFDYDHVPPDKIESLKQKLQKNKHVYTVFVSPSGEGLKAIVPTNCKTKESHSVVYKRWGKLGVQSRFWDENVHDFSRLMFLSWDPDLIINDDCVPFDVPGTIIEKDQKDQKKRNIKPLKQGARGTSFGTRDIYSVLETVIPQLPASLADGRLTWISGINAIISEFGEAGRPLVHLFSALSSKYDHAETNKQFDYELDKFVDQGAKIGTIAYWAKVNRIPFYSDHEMMFKNGRSVSSVAEELNISEDDAKKIKEGIKETVKTPVVAVEHIKEQYDFRTNIVSGMVESESTGEVISPPDIYTDLLKEGYDLSPNQISTMCRSSEIAPKFDPISEYFKSLDEFKIDEQDEFKSINRLCDAIVLEDESQKDWFKLMLQKMLVRCVSCGIGNSPNRTVFVLTDGNRQYIGKSTWIRYIGGFDAYRNPVTKLSKYYLEEELKNDKDMDIAICENFIWNVEEYESLSPRDLSKFKMTVSKAGSKVRRPYAMFAENLSRRCSFFASTNHDEMLSDGNNTRYIVFRVKDVLRNYQDGDDKVNMDSVWAEAYLKYKADPAFGELTREDLGHQNKMNDSHRIGDQLEDYILDIYDPDGEWLNVPVSIFNRAAKTNGLMRSAQHATKIITDLPHAITKGRSKTGRYISIRTTPSKIARVYEDGDAAHRNPYLSDENGQAYMGNRSMRDVIGQSASF